ncbi:MAG TPA: dihydroorotate dehydrogenase [Polyangiaceae bacterium]|jgi:dihydroorotate dehydrogenase (NAD+) catalytic subunit
MTTQAIRIGSLTLKNPVLTASGCFGYGLEYDDFYDVTELGGICTKGLSLHPRLGNPPERICETPAGMLNAIGLANVGVEAFCTEKLPILRARGVTVIANIFASSVDDFAAIAARLERDTGVHAIELNLSCPNVTEGGIEFGRDAEMCARVTRAVREVTRIPVWVKVTPEAGDIVAVGRACEAAGAEALTAINTIRGMSVDVEGARLRLANRTGGFSGPALRPIALRVVWELVSAVSIPVIGIGGITTVRDALEFLMVGASAVQVGTANFGDPCAAKKVVDGIAAYCLERQTTVVDLVGKAR